LCRCDVQRRCASGKHSGHRESHSGIGRKPFAFPPESLFAFSPESRSPSPRNAFHVHPGILFAFARNPHTAPACCAKSSRSLAAGSSCWRAYLCSADSGASLSGAGAAGDWASANAAENRKIIVRWIVRMVRECITVRFSEQRLLKVGFTDTEFHQEAARCRVRCAKWLESSSS
jgi:hypothetical protein